MHIHHMNLRKFHCGGTFSKCQIQQMTRTGILKTFHGRRCTPKPMSAPYLWANMRNANSRQVVPGRRILLFIGRIVFFIQNNEIKRKRSQIALRVPKII